MTTFLQKTFFEITENGGSKPEIKKIGPKFFGSDWVEILHVALKNNSKTKVYSTKM